MLSLPNSFLEAAADRLKAGQTVRLRVGGRSMLPFLHDGKEIIVVEPARAAQLQQGDIVFFRNANHYIIHRLVGYHNGLYILQGDGNCCGQETASEGEILGVVVRIEYANGKVRDCRSRVWRYSSRLWMALKPLRPYLLRLCRKK